MKLRRLPVKAGVQITPGDVVQLNTQTGEVEPCVAGGHLIGVAKAVDCFEGKSFVDVAVDGSTQYVGAGYSPMLDDTKAQHWKRERRRLPKRRRPRRP